MVMPLRSVELVLNVSISSTGHCNRLLPVLVSNNTVRGIDCIHTRKSQLVTPPHASLEII
uniref:Uncharacterized protein n=1 Tax=Arundo donax TaxID=35708 RepID=A0A0A9EIX2_ARUDO